MIATLVEGGQALRVDLARGHDLSLGPDRRGQGPRHFGAPPAGFAAWETRGFSGDVGTGASCNCSVLTLIPHCQGTHTECVGHLTREPLDAFGLLPLAPVPAVLLSVNAVASSPGDEVTDPAAQGGDTLITARALEEALQRLPRAASSPARPRALLLRTRPNDAGKRLRDYAAHPAPFLTTAAAQWLVDHCIEHLVVDLPSIDRAHDQGRLSAHRIFFGLPAGSQSLREALRAHATLTELAFIDDAIADGPGLLSLQAARLPGDALPSRPVFYPLLADMAGGASR